MSDNENPYKPTSEPHPQVRDSEPVSTDARQAVRNACRYAIPVMSIGWVLLTVEFYFSNSHRMTPLLAVIVACFQALAFAGFFLGIWLGCAAIVGSMRK